MLNLQRYNNYLTLCVCFFYYEYFKLMYKILIYYKIHVMKKTLLLMSALLFAFLVWASEQQIYPPEISNIVGSTEGGGKI